MATDQKNAFIGIDALNEVATKVGSQIIMGPAYTNAELLKRMRIKVISGIQFKQVETVLMRKGGTTRRKKVGNSVESNLGLLKERKLEVKLAWNRFRDNIDNYVETVFGTNGRAGGKYPLSTSACEGILKTYAEDNTDNLFFGDVDKEKTQPGLALYTGFHTYLAHDIALGLINKANRNLIECDAIVAPVDADDSTPYDTVFEAFMSLDPRLRKQKEILCYCDVLRGVYIAQGYANKNHSHVKVKYKDDGTFTIPEMPRVTFVPEDAFGVGDRLIFTIPENFQYGVDSLGNQTFVKAQVGSDQDMQDIIFQIQSLQGTRVLQIQSSCFAMTNGSIAENAISGDFRNAKLVVNYNETECSGVKVNGEAYDEPKEFAENAIITVEATAAAGYKFDRWSTGSTDNPLAITATGMPIVVAPIFTKA